MSNNDNPLIKQCPSYRTGLYDSEICGGKFIVTQQKYIDRSYYMFDDKWHYIAGTYDPISKKIAIYFDGVRCNSKILSGLVNYSISVADSNLLIGRHKEYYFNGLIDYVRLYNRALNEEEIYQNYQGNITTKGLASWWKFDEGFGNIAHDDVGYNNGIIYGATWVEEDNVTALLFDGINDYVDCGNREDLTFTKGLTIEARVKTVASFGHQIIVAKWDERGNGYLLESYRPWAPKGEFIVFVNHSRENIRIPLVNIYTFDYDYAHSLMYLTNFSRIKVCEFHILPIEESLLIIRFKSITNRCFMMGTGWYQIPMYLTAKDVKRLSKKLFSNNNIIYDNGIVNCLITGKEENRL